MCANKNRVRRVGAQVRRGDIVHSHSNYATFGRDDAESIQSQHQLSTGARLTLTRSLLDQRIAILWLVTHYRGQGAVLLDVPLPECASARQPSDRASEHFSSALTCKLARWTPDQLLHLAPHPWMPPQQPLATISWSAHTRVRAENDQRHRCCSTALCTSSRSTTAAAAVRASRTSLGATTATATTSTKVSFGGSLERRRRLRGSTSARAQSEPQPTTTAAAAKAVSARVKAVTRLKPRPRPSVSSKRHPSQARRLSRRCSSTSS